VFHQGVVRRSETTFEAHLGVTHDVVKFFMAFNHSLPAAQGPRRREELPTLEQWQAHAVRRG
jgi:hypothetical protein